MRGMQLVNERGKGGFSPPLFVLLPITLILLNQCRNELMAGKRAVLKISKHALSERRQLLKTEKEETNLGDKGVTFHSTAIFSEALRDTITPLVPVEHIITTSSSPRNHTQVLLSPETPPHHPLERWWVGRGVIPPDKEKGPDTHHSHDIYR